MDGGAGREPLGGVRLFEASLQEAREYLGRRGNPQSRKRILDCFAALAMTDVWNSARLGILSFQIRGYCYK
jgi:hypothetical protein